MEQPNEPVEPELEPAEGPRPEQEEGYERAQRELSEQPLQEPAEGSRQAAGSR